MDKELLYKLQKINEELSADGFQIEGVFGSFARGQQRDESDIDILYILNKEFRDKYKGFNAISRLDDIQKIISSMLGLNADLVQKETLSSLSAKNILPDLQYVK